MLYDRERSHAAVAAAFIQLQRVRSRLVTPLPIVFEVHKWLLYQRQPAVAALSLQRMRDTLEIVYPRVADVDEIVELLATMPTWRGSLEDALVALTALKLDVRVWTMNYRDFAAFRNLQFWVPSTV